MHCLEYNELIKQSIILILCEKEERNMKTQEKYFNAVDTGAEYIKEQIQDGGKNIVTLQTYKDILNGFKSAATSAYYFKIFNHRSRDRYRITPSHPELTEPRLEDNPIAVERADDELIEEIKLTRKQIIQTHQDGKLITGAFGFEAAFMGLHFQEAAHAAEDGDGWNLLVSTYSIMMASGAFAYLGRQVTSLFHVANSRRYHMAEQYKLAEDQYTQRAPT